MGASTLSSAGLPTDFFAPATRRDSGELAPGVQRRFRYLSTATSSLLQVIAIGAGLSWLAFLLLAVIGLPSRIPAGAGIFERVLAWGSTGLLLLAAASVTGCGLLRARRWYTRVMGLAAGCYGLLLACHTLSLWLTGGSAWSAVRLGDYSAIPAALLVAA